MIRFGVIGYGYWGPNIVRNLRMLEAAQVVAICDKNPAALCRAAQMCPGATLTSDYDDLIRSPEIDVVAIITPVWTHFDLARRRCETASMSLSKSLLLQPQERRKS